MNKVTLPPEITALIKDSIYAYLHNVTEMYEYTTKDERRFTTHGSELNGKFIRCLQGSRMLPAGTKGYLWVRHNIAYDKVVWIGDAQYPAEGAKATVVSTYYQFFTVIDLPCGDRVLASAFECVEAKDVPANFKEPQTLKEIGFYSRPTVTR
jgi:hypothetical protein